MIYRNFQDERISMLGFGVMRLPVVDGNDALIDEEPSLKMIDEAIAGGINYFDTAWGYHGGASELILGKALKKYPRDSFYLATKFPGYSLSNFGKVEEVFEQQLKKCQVEYFDFYLLHNVCELNIDAYLNDEKYKTYQYLVKQKQNGRIRHLGFSAHGTLETMKRFLELYGENMEFCQIQMNYLDWEFQDAKEKIELLKEYHLPVWVMEPLRGGKLAKLPEKHTATLQKLRPSESIPAWSFRFLQTIPDVTVVLSGMSTSEQLKDNICIFSDEKPLNQKETQTLIEIAREMTQATSIPCTSCHYCVNHCPQGLDIPYLIDLYNEKSFTKEAAFIASMRLEAMEESQHPSACLGCRSCEAVCPQQIKISKVLADFDALMKKKQDTSNTL